LTSYRADALTLEASFQFSVLGSQQNRCRVESGQLEADLFLYDSYTTPTKKVTAAALS
jgi:hypothetical protein